MNIEDAREFILSKVIWPGLSSPSVSSDAKESIKKTKQWIESCKYIGDIYEYINRFSGLEDNRYSGVYSELKSNGLIPIEDIIEPFRQTFKDNLHEVFEVSMLEEGVSYSSWDLAIIARSFNVQRGILLLEKNGEIEEILTKVTLGEGRYPNVWIEPGKVLKHFMLTFKGKTNRDFKTNKAIIESNGKPIRVFLKSGTKCIYDGIYDFVKDESDTDGSRWFILQKRGTSHPIDYYKHLQDFERSIERTAALPMSVRSEEMSKLPVKPTKKTAIVEVFERSPFVVVAVLERAKGTCESCLKPAPFLRAKDNTPFLEVHHKVPLAKGGEDTLENALAVCPNCHRKAHYG